MTFQRGPESPSTAGDGEDVRPDFRLIPFTQRRLWFNQFVPSHFGKMFPESGRYMKIDLIV